MSRFPFLVLAVALAAALACQPPASEPTEPAAPAADEIAAEIGGAPLTTAELDAWIKDELWRRNTASPPDLYELRRDHLDRLIDERVVTTEAEARGVAPEAVIEQLVSERGPVTDEELKTFYDENQAKLGSATFDDVKDRLRSFLEARRSREVIDALKEKYGVAIHLVPPRSEVAATGPSRGPADARVTIVEFSDFQCPYCRRALATIDALLEAYPKDVRIVYRQFPLRGHARAQPAAEASLCADAQGRFWEYHDKLFTDSRGLGDAELLTYADEIGLDGAAFRQCVSERRFKAQVEQDEREGRAAGASGTPAFFVNGVLVSGAKPVDEFKRLIDAELAGG